MREHTWVKVIATSFAAVSAVASTINRSVTALVLENRNAAKRYLQLFDQREALVGGEAPTLSIPIGPTSAVLVGSDILGVDGTLFSKGVVFGWSTTPATYTAATAADHDTQILGG